MTKSKKPFFDWYKYYCSLLDTFDCTLLDTFEHDYLGILDAIYPRNDESGFSSAFAMRLFNCLSISKFESKL